MVANETGKKDKLFNFRPALFAAIFLMAGIAFGYYHVVNGVSASWLLLLLLVPLLFLPFSINGQDFIRRTLLVFMLVACFFLGLICFRYQVNDYARGEHYQGEVAVVGTVENRRSRNGSYRITLSDVYIDEKEVKGVLNAYLPISFEDEIGVSDRVVVKGKIKTNLSLTNDYGFRESEIGKNIRYTVTAEDCVCIGQSKNVFLRIRARIEEVAYAGMDEMPAALTLALMTGDSAGVDEDLDENMRYGGISHIFAVSGLNVGALFLFCLFIFAKTPMRRSPKWVRFCLLFAILFLYSGICGFTASVLRAAVMCLVGYFTLLLGLNADLLEAMGIAAIALLLVKPSELFAVGFQLSFLACLGLFTLAKPIGQVFDEWGVKLRKRFPRKYTSEEKKYLAEGGMLPTTIGEDLWHGASSLVSATLAAQITTAPALLIHFGYLSGWSLLLNFVFVPLIDGAFIILFVLVLIACLLPTVFAVYLLYLPSVLWSAAMLVFEVVDFSSFALRDVQISALFCVCYYGGLSFLTDKWNISKRLKMGLAILLLFACGLVLFL